MRDIVSKSFELAAVEYSIPLKEISNGYGEKMNVFCNLGGQ